MKGASKNLKKVFRCAFIGIDLHTNRFTCCYRDEKSSVDNPKERVRKRSFRAKTFELDEMGLAMFYRTLTYGNLCAH
jgi:hypothetical protein